MVHHFDAQVRSTSQLIARPMMSLHAMRMVFSLWDHGA